MEKDSDITLYAVRLLANACLALDHRNRPIGLLTSLKSFCTIRLLLLIVTSPFVCIFRSELIRMSQERDGMKPTLRTSALSCQVHSRVDNFPFLHDAHGSAPKQRELCGVTDSESLSQTRMKKPS